MLDANESEQNEECADEGPDYNLTDNYGEKVDDLPAEDEQSWWMKWVGNPLLIIITAVLTAFFAVITVGIFMNLVLAFFMSANASFTVLVTSASNVQYSSWSALGLGLLPISLGAFVFCCELLGQRWTGSVRERRPSPKKKTYA